MCWANIEFHQHQGLASPGKWGHALQSSCGSFYFPIFLTQTPALNPGTACGEGLGGQHWSPTSPQPPKMDLMPLIPDFPALWSCSDGGSKGCPTPNSPTTQTEEQTTQDGEFSVKKKLWHNLVIPLFRIPIIWFKNTSFVGSWLLLHWDSLIQSCVLFSGGMPHVFIFQSLISANSSISARSKVVLLFRSAIFFPKWTKWKVDAQCYLKIIIKNI